VESQAHQRKINSPAPKDMQFAASVRKKSFHDLPKATA
jgi:hypothetical protein